MTAWKVCAIGTLLVLGTAAWAETAAESVVRQLREQGYVELTVERTWLGRIQVIAVAPDGSQREIVFSPATGEILRDYSAGSDGAPMSPQIIDRGDPGSDSRSVSPLQGGGPARPDGREQEGGGPDGAGSPPDAGNGNRPDEAGGQRNHGGNGGPRIPGPSGRDDDDGGEG